MADLLYGRCNAASTVASTQKIKYKRFPALPLKITCWA